MMMKQVLIVLIFALAFAYAAEEIEKCNKKEVELRVARESCEAARGQLATAAADKHKYDSEYEAANVAFDKSVSTFIVVEREEHKAKADLHGAEAALTVARKAEDSYCNKLVRNVKEGTACAKLLNKARKNNRLQLCKDSQKALEKAETKVAELRKIYNEVDARLRAARVNRITKEKLRDEALDRRKRFDGIHTVKRDAKIAACARYDSLRVTFNGNKGVRTLIGATVMLESLNYPKHFLRHRNFQSYIDRADSVANDKLYEVDRRFIVRKGLAGKGISLESVNYPGYYLRHANFRVILSKQENSKLYKEDASFMVKKSIAGNKGFFSFESVNYPNFFIRHSGYAGWLNKQENSKLYKEDASYRIVIVSK